MLLRYMVFIISEKRSHLFLKSKYQHLTITLEVLQMSEYMLDHVHSDYSSHCPEQVILVPSLCIPLSKQNS